MYRGNMYEFTEKVNKYLKEKYKCRLIFGYFKKGGSTYYLAFFGPTQMSATAYAVYDREDFEQQVIDFINNELNILEDV